MPGGTPRAGARAAPQPSAAGVGQRRGVSPFLHFQTKKPPLQAPGAGTERGMKRPPHTRLASLHRRDEKGAGGRFQCAAREGRVRPALPGATAPPRLRRRCRPRGAFKGWPTWQQQPSGGAARPGAPSPRPPFPPPSARARPGPGRAAAAAGSTLLLPPPWARTTS